LTEEEVEYYSIIDGEHRWKAAKLLGWKKIRCAVREVNEDRAQEINYAKNRLRGHINPFKEAEMFDVAWKKLARQEDVAMKFGISQSYVANALALGRIPEEIQKIIPRGINRSLLEVLARIEDPADQETLAKKIAGGFTVREAEDFAKSLETDEVSSPGKTEEKAKEIVLQLVDGEEQKVSASQVTKVKEVTIKKQGKLPVVEWRVEFHDESGILCSRDVTEKCGLELETLGFNIEHIDLSEPEKPSGVPMKISTDQTLENMSKGVPSEKSAQPKEELPTLPAKKELDFDAKGKLCPICGHVVSEDLYEHLKKKFTDFEGLFK